MVDLDDEKEVGKLDKSNMLSSIEALGKQVSQTWDEMKYFDLPEDYKEIDSVVVSGMGGSNLGCEIIQSLYFESFPVSLRLVRGYHLPKYVNHRTLVILSSYSGSTEETLSCGKEALERGAKIIGIATGSKLEAFCNERHLPFFKINPVNNPCGQPRMGLGYSIIAQFGIFSKLGLIEIGDGDIDKVVYLLQENNKRYGIEAPKNRNNAKIFAKELVDRIVIYMSSEFLFGISYAIRNQLNENAKHFGAVYEIPEINHHLMEGLKFPEKNIDSLTVLLLNSDLYDKNNMLRIDITKEVLKQNHIDFLEFNAMSESKLFQAFEVLGFGSYLNFYISMLHGLDPSPIPYVDYFKKELERRRKS